MCKSREGSVLTETYCGLIFFENGDGNLSIHLDSRLSEEDLMEVLGQDGYPKDGESIEALLSRLPSRTAAAIRRRLQEGDLARVIHLEPEIDIPNVPTVVNEGDDRPG